MLPTAHTAERVRRPLPEGPVDVAVVGAGLGGLVAAAALARAGYRVACFDQHYVAGGCATMFARGRADARFAFDVGIHYVGDCGPTGRLPKLLHAAGAEVEWVPLDPDGFDTLVFPDFRFRIPVDRDLYRDRLVEMFPHERKGIDRYCGFLRQVERAGGRMESAGSGWRTMLDVALHARDVVRYRSATVDQVLDDCVKDPKLRAVLVGQAGDYGVAPSEASALLHAGLQNHYFKGAYYPKGGGQVIADALCAEIEAHGGSVHLRCGVSRIRVEGGRAVGLQLEEGGHFGGARIDARIVLSNADLRRTMFELVGPEHLPASAVQQARGWKMGGALYLLALGVRGGPRITNTNIWAFDGYDMNEMSRAMMGPDGPVVHGCYVTSASAKDPTTPGHAPAGHSTLEVMALVPGDHGAWGVSDDDTVLRGRYRQNPVYKERKARVEADLVRRLDALFPGISGDIVFREGASPLTQTRYTRATNGTGYGLAATPDQFLQNRPGYRGPIEALFLCGSSTRAGHGIGGVVSGGWKAARRVAEALGGTLDAP